MQPNWEQECRRPFASDTWTARRDSFTGRPQATEHLPEVNKRGYCWPAKHMPMSRKSAPFSADWIKDSSAIKIKTWLSFRAGMSGCTASRQFGTAACGTPHHSTQDATAGNDMFGLLWSEIERTFPPNIVRLVSQ